MIHFLFKTVDLCKEQSSFLPFSSWLCSKVNEKFLDKCKLYEKLLLLSSHFFMLKCNVAVYVQAESASHPSADFVHLWPGGQPGAAHHDDGAAHTLW